jgi:hypothetical protein
MAGTGGLGGEAERPATGTGISTGDTGSESPRRTGIGTGVFGGGTGSAWGETGGSTGDFGAGGVGAGGAGAGGVGAGGVGAGGVGAGTPVEERVPVVVLVGASFCSSRRLGVSLSLLAVLPSGWFASLSAA